MILAHHCIFGFHGFWLPNDPRGSGSDYVAVWELYRYGRATKVSKRRSVAHRSIDPTWKRAAQTALKYPPVEITGAQALAIVEGFRQAILDGDYAIHACAVLPDHVHLVIGRHERDIRQIVGHLKAKATRALRQSGRWPADGRDVWGEHGWNVALDGAADVDRAVRYVEENPLKEGKKRQEWDIVTPFNERVAREVRFSGAVHALGGAALRSHLRKTERELAARRQRRG
jgi:REP element-mobilizing transposase RayT